MTGKHPYCGFKRRQSERFAGGEEEIYRKLLTQEIKNGSSHAAKVVVQPKYCLELTHITSHITNGIIQVNKLLSFNITTRE